MIIKTIKVPNNLTSKRLDIVATELFEEFSRNKILDFIKNEYLTVDNKILKPKDKVYSGQTLALNAPKEKEINFNAQNIDLNIVYEDEELLVINKQANFVVHPAVGNYEGTLLNALLFHNEQAANLPRAGIVHRLDKDTTGLMVVAKTQNAYNSLTEQLKDKTVNRVYYALVVGKPAYEGEINLPIGRDKNNRQKQAVVSDGKEAKTFYKRIWTDDIFSLMEIRLHTGRTHQIRVHFSHLKFPLIGDQTYGSKRKFLISPEKQNFIDNFNRQALHAKNLSFRHPGSNKIMKFSSDLPADFVELLEVIDDEFFEYYE